MRFFGRDEELRELKRIRDLSVSNSRFTVITGRRRVGKTELIEQAFGGATTPYLYFLVTNRAEKELCGILQEEVERVLEEPILGRAERFAQLLEIVMKASQKSPLTLVFDEFQEFDKINPAIYGEIQGVWDRLHKKSKINLVVCGSVNRMMYKIFFDDSQRELILKVQPFGERSATKNCLYWIDDCFFRFWFRFIYKYQHLIEQKMFDELASISSESARRFSRRIRN